MGLVEDALREEAISSVVVLQERRTHETGERQTRVRHQQAEQGTVATP